MTGPAGRGTLVVADRAVRRIAERAAGEALPGASAVGSVELHGRRAAVDLRVTLPYDTPLAESAERVRQHVAERTGRLTGLDVPAPRLTVTRLRITSGRTAAASPPAHGDSPAPSPVPPPAGADPAGADPAASPDRDRPARRSPRRLWSGRSTPMAVLALLAAAASAAVTADVLRVHLTGRPAAVWRAHTVNWLSAHGPQDTAVVVGGACMAALGVWLCVLAATPGCRRWLTLLADGGAPGAVVDRSTVAALVRDAVAATPGVTAVRVRAGRRRVLVRARLGFGDRDRAHASATAAACRAVDGCLLRRAPRVSVRTTATPGPGPRPSLPGPDTAQATATDAATATATATATAPPVPVAVPVRAGRRPAGGEG
ncbi:DUF6286 domain-containing Asp23/Gls24 family envelope stress response protein [Streptomyces sp. NPDC005573]|uniref:DUF6286 domain-containing Asp23/Gls24 family envelope stress response protein n=1 Tax=Streptomyces sp. NPDC005573 TaxID=3156890 RepID=UPI0033B4E825